MTKSISGSLYDLHGAAAAADLAHPARGVLRRVLPPNRPNPPVLPSLPKARALFPGRVEELSLVAHQDEIARDHHVAKSAIERAVRTAYQNRNFKGWCQYVIPGQIYDKGIVKQTDWKFLHHQEAVGAMPELFFRSRVLGRGKFSSAEELASLNTGESLALKLTLDVSKEDPRPVMDMVTFLNRDHAHTGLIRKPYQFCSFEETVWVRRNNQLVPMSCKRMGYIEKKYGRNLEKNPPKTAELFRKFLSDITDGFLHLHLRGISHGDLKPNNMMRDPETNEFMIGDLGKSKRYVSEDGNGLKKEFFDAYIKFCRLKETHRWNVERQKEVAMMFLKGGVDNSGFFCEALVSQFCAAYDYGADWKLLRNAFMRGDWAEFRKIEESRNVYALGASIIDILDPVRFFPFPEPNNSTILNLPKQLSLEDIEDIKDMGYKKNEIESVEKNLTLWQIKALHGKGLNKEQVVVIALMIGDSAHRPNAPAIYRAFHQREVRAEAQGMPPAAAAAAAAASPLSDSAHSPSPPPSPPLLAPDHHPPKIINYKGRYSEQDPVVKRGMGRASLSPVPEEEAEEAIGAAAVMVMRPMVAHHFSPQFQRIMPSANAAAAAFPMVRSNYYSPHPSAFCVPAAAAAAAAPRIEQRYGAPFPLGLGESAAAAAAAPRIEPRYGALFPLGLGESAAAAAAAPKTKQRYGAPFPLGLGESAAAAAAAAAPRIEPRYCAPFPLGLGESAAAAAAAAAHQDNAPSLPSLPPTIGSAQSGSGYGDSSHGPIQDKGEEIRAQIEKLKLSIKEAIKERERCYQEMSGNYNPKSVAACMAAKEKIKQYKLEISKWKEKLHALEKPLADAPKK